MADKRPEWAVDAIDNPSPDDGNLDPYAAFDPEGEDIATSAQVGDPTALDFDSLNNNIIDSYNFGKEIADQAEIDNYVLPDVRDRRLGMGDVANFLFGDEMGAIGIKIDKGQASWSMENAMQQWSEHPLRTSLALASWALPGAGKLAKIRSARLLNLIPDDELVAAGKFSNSDAVMLAKVNDPDAIRLGKSQIYHDNKYADLDLKASQGNLSVMEQLQFGFYNNFAHAYTKLSDPSSPIAANLKHKEMMNRTIKDEVVDKFLGDLPDAIHGPLIAKIAIGKAHMDDLPSDVRPWAVNLLKGMEDAQAHGLETGFITKEMMEKVGPRYVPVIYTEYGRKLGGATEQLRIQRGKQFRDFNAPRLSSDALRQRNTTLDEFADWIDEGYVNVDPNTLTVQGLMEQRMLQMNFEFMRDMAVNPKFSKSFDELTDAGESLNNWVNLDEIGGHAPGIIKRMISKSSDAPHLADSDRYIKLEAFENIFGKNGMVAQSRESLKAFESMVRIHKTAKTAFNLFTHGQNLSGNMVFLSQAGYRLFTGAERAENWTGLKGAIGNVNRHYKRAVGLSDEPLKPMTFKGRTWAADEIQDEFDNPWVYDLIEQGSFLRAEGSNGELMERIASKAENVNDYLGKLTRSVQKGAETAKRYYNVEDAGPKFAYYMQLRSRGLTAEGAAREVARRLPVYNGIAAGPQLGRAVGADVGPRVGPGALRKWMFPWISFPAEAARITKNNLIDHPMRMAAWLHSPQIAQSVIYGASHAMGIGEPLSYTDYDGLKKQLPMYAQRPGAVMTPFKDRNDDFRAMMLDFIPQMSFMPSTLAEEAPASQKIPVVSPGDIAPILTGMLGIMTGRGPFGEEIKATSASDKAGKMIANAIGFVSPPVIQKYFFNITSPRAQSVTGVNTYRLEQDLGQMINPQTGKPGSWLADTLFSNTIMRNYAASAEQEMHNKQLHTNRTVDRVRGELTRRFNAAARSGAVDESNQYLKQVMGTFSREYQNPQVAQQKFVEWVIRHRKSILRHPQLRRYSEEDFIRMILENNDITMEQRTIANKQTAEALNKELMMRNMQ